VRLLKEKRRPQFPANRLMPYARRLNYFLLESLSLDFEDDEEDDDEPDDLLG
jgi:hypothetical protein